MPSKWKINIKILGVGFRVILFSSSRSTIWSNYFQQMCYFYNKSANFLKQ